MFDVKFNASEPMNADFDGGQELTADFSDTIAVTDLDYNHLENHPSIEGHELVGDSTLEDIGVVIPEVPTKVSELENDAHYATVSQLPTVPTNVSAFTNDANYATVSQLPIIPAVISAFTNDVGYVTESAIPEVPTKTSDLTNDSDFTTSAAVTAALADKVDKVSGKGLSTEDYTTAEQTKLSGLDPHSMTPIELTNEDLNDLHPLTTTIYYGVTGNTCLHKPTVISTNTFSLICLRVNATYMQQILIHPTSARAWRRLWNGTGWQNSGTWVELLITYPAGQTYPGLMSAADKKKFDQLSASTINVKDTKGLCGTVGATVTIQALMDAIANRV